MAYLASRSSRGLDSCLKVLLGEFEGEVVGTTDDACYTECARVEELKGSGKRATIAFLVNVACYAVQLAP